MICVLIFAHLIVWFSLHQSRTRSYGAQQSRNAPCVETDVENLSYRNTEYPSPSGEVHLLRFTSTNNRLFVQVDRMRKHCGVREDHAIAPYSKPFRYGRVAFLKVETADCVQLYS